MIEFSAANGTFPFFLTQRSLEPFSYWSVLIPFFFDKGLWREVIEFSATF